MNFRECTPVQEHTIPVILEGKDLIGVAQTGTGKTAAYLLPVINELSKGGYPADAINCIIMSPTRELAQQIAKELDLPREEVVFAMDAVVDPVSLFDPVYSDGGDTVCVMDQVRDTRNTDESWLDRIALREAVDKLSPREQRILAMRFYDGKTQMEVSGEIGISQAQVSRLEKNAISTIRRNL